MRLLLTILCFIALQAQGQALFHAHNRSGVTASPCADADACAFLSATQITDPELNNDILWLVDTLKSTALWSSLYAVYPFASDGVEQARADQHTYNLINPSLYKITWYGTITHTATGVEWDGASGYGRTGLLLSQLDPMHNHLSYYSREMTGGAFGEIGANGGPNPRAVLHIRWADDKMYYQTPSGADGSVSAANTDERGYFIGSRTANNDIAIYKNGTQLAQSTSTAGPQTLPAVQIYVGAINENGSAVLYTHREAAFATVGAGLTPAQAVTLSAIVNRFQIKRNRNVY